MNDERVESVKRALRLLVVDPGPGAEIELVLADGREGGADDAAGGIGERPRARIDRTEAAIRRAEAAVEDVREAARFADADGFAELERAVAAAESDERPGIAARRDAILETVDAYRTAASDHFRRGREGLMPGERVLPDETT